MNRWNDWERNTRSTSPGEVTKVGKCVIGQKLYVSVEKFFLFSKFPLKVNLKNSPPLIVIEHVLRTTHSCIDFQIISFIFFRTFSGCLNFLSAQLSMICVLSYQQNVPAKFVDEVFRRASSKWFRITKVTSQCVLVFIFVRKLNSNFLEAKFLSFFEYFKIIFKGK